MSTTESQSDEKPKMVHPVARVISEDDQEAQEYVELAQEKLSKHNKEMKKFWRDKYERESAKNWNNFYKQNGNRVFKDRHWFNREFPEVLENENDDEEAGKKVVLECGCGTGATVYPLLEINPNLFVHCFDFSQEAVGLVLEHPQYSEESVHAFQCDLTKEQGDGGLLDHVEQESVDFVFMIFVLSAIAPQEFDAVMERIFKVLKPGGMAMFRDYARYDLSQYRFDKSRKITDNYYARGDGTKTYFFDKEELQEMFEKSGFEVTDMDMVIREITNRKENKKMHRRWIQAKVKKPE